MPENRLFDTLLAAELVVGEPEPDMKTTVMEHKDGSQQSEPARLSGSPPGNGE